MQRIFPNIVVNVSFNSGRDTYINVTLQTTNSTGVYSLDLAGTGVLQALQIFSYVTLFEPQLLLLDEPDSHLHPDNQVLLANAFRVVASETGTQVILATHSRHLVEALREESNFIWLKGGAVAEQGVGLDHLPLLIDLGALNDFDRLKAGKIQWVFLSEDVDMRPLKTLTYRLGFEQRNTLFFSYRGVSNLETAATLATFIKDFAPATNIIIQRDRYFMTDSEVQCAIQKVSKCGAAIFLTEGSDVESYFITPDHIAEVISMQPADVTKWLEEIAEENHNALQHAFTRKRDDTKKLIYKKDPDKCPDTLALLGEEIPLNSEKRLGKFMLSKVHGSMKSKIGSEVNLIRTSSALSSPALRALVSSIDPHFFDNEPPF
jgi:energy-coupling factor transporter ATP-binding protein EcfA2